MLFSFVSILPKGKSTFFLLFSPETMLRDHKPLVTSFRPCLGVRLGLSVALGWVASVGAGYIHARQAPPPVEQRPIVAASVELRDGTLLRELRKGGYVLYLRHSETGEITPTCDKTNLTAAGEQQAKELGRKIREFAIPIGEVTSSPACRALDTARLLSIGEVSISDALNQVPSRPGLDLAALRVAKLNEMPLPGRNRLLVSHMHGGPDKDRWMHLEIGEMIVFRPDASGLPVPVARIRAQEWDRLIETAK